MNWRLITYGEFDPAFNMAADEAILDAHLAGEVPPTLRVYGWNPAAISVGYAQKISDEEKRSIAHAGLALVRRPTGGRAVLHLGDLTYSFVGTSIGGSQDRLHTSIDDPGHGFLSTNIAGAYKQICDGLIEAIKEFGITLALGASNSDYRSNYDCFRATTNADLQYEGKKIIGSAQLRRKHAVLQHGSILLNQEQNKMAQIFGESQNDRIRHANLFEILSTAPTMEALQDAMQIGFQKAFAETLVPSPLMPKELERIEILIQKYRM
jgi:lipoyl(octanoyl) transferase